MQTSKLPLCWFKGKKTQAEKDEFSKRLKECSDVIERLAEICKSKQNESLRYMRDKTTLNSSGSATAMARELGYQAAIDDLLTVLGERNG